MAFEKIKVANPIVEMDGEISFSLSISLCLAFRLFDTEMKRITFRLPSSSRSFVLILELKTSFTFTISLFFD